MADNGINSGSLGSSGAIEREFNKYGAVYSVVGKNNSNPLFNSSGTLKSSAQFEELLEDSGIQNSCKYWLSKFNRFSYLDPYNAPVGNKEYIFFTKPDLNLFNGTDTSSLNPNLENNAYFVDMHNRYRHIMKQLCLSVNTSNKYMTVLSDSVASSLELPDVAGETSDTNENLFGDKLEYRHGSEISDVGFEFSLEFHDTYNLEVYNLFKMWDMYYKCKTLGIVEPPKKSYVYNMILHDQISIYKFIVSEDYETILFYAKYYGVFPKELPRSTFGSLDNGEIKMNINFHSSFVVDNDPLILADFNKLALKSSETLSSLKAAPIYDTSKRAVNRKWVGKPFVVLDKTLTNGAKTAGSKGVYKLKWRDV